MLRRAFLQLLAFAVPSWLFKKEPEVTGLQMIQCDVVPDPGWQDELLRQLFEPRPPAVGRVIWNGKDVTDEILH